MRIRPHAIEGPTTARRDRQPEAVLVTMHRVSRWLLLLASAAGAITAGACGAGPTASSGSNGTSAPTGSVVITINPSVIYRLDTISFLRVPGCPAAGCAQVDTLRCPTYNPNPASVAAGQAVVWYNNSGATVTLFQQGGSNPPITTVGPGANSAGVHWAQSGTITYKPSICSINSVYTADDQLGNGIYFPSGTIYITVAQ
jgi:hypothetical protein